MVVAFGTAKKSAFTGSAVVVDNEKISQRITSNVSNALVGVVPGLQMKGQSGAPGATGSIDIRGFNSLYATSAPLIIVDGAPYSLGLSYLNPNDIESISVLKDAASAALYGARGAGGVIIVTTKKGSDGKDANITVDTKFGFSNRAIPEYDMVDDPAGYYELMYKQHFNKLYYLQGQSLEDANVNANKLMMDALNYNVYKIPNGEQLIGTDGKLNPKATLGNTYEHDGITYYLQPDNWDDYAYQTGIRQEYNVSVNGGNRRGSYFSSLGYVDETSVVKHYHLKLLKARLKADYQATSWLKVGTNIAFTQRESNVTANSIFSYTSSLPPIYPLYVRALDANGNPYIMTDSEGRIKYDYGKSSNSYPTLDRATGEGNPLALNEYNRSYGTTNVMNATLTADVSFTKQLKLNIQSSLIWTGSKSTDYENPYFGVKAGVNGELKKSMSSGMRTNNVQTLSYINDFGNHSVRAMIGHEFYKNSSSDITAIGQGGFSPEILELNAFTKRNHDAGSSSSSYNVEGFFGSLQYDYNDKYFASASLRRDASGVFDPHHKWGNFWSVGGAWLLNKDLLQNQRWIDMLKLKASIGQQGNDNIGNYYYTDVYTLKKASDTQMSVEFSRMGNPGITWETTTNFNIGTEFSLWKGRLSGTLDVYTKKTSNLIFWIQIPESSGVRGFYDNIGEILNRGFELSLTGTLIRTKNLNWNVSVNATHNYAKILNLPLQKTKEYGGFYTDSNWYKEGGPYINMALKKTAGLNENGEALYWVDNEAQSYSYKMGKSLDYTTTDPNKASYYEFGSTLPSLYGGITSNLRYGNFDLALTMDYQIGGKIYDARYASLMTTPSTPTSAGMYHVDMLRAWSPTNTSSTIPRWYNGDKYSTYSSDRFFINAGYLNFQSLVFGYTLPKGIIKGISKLRAYVSGENFGFFSARKGLDPRQGYSSTSSNETYSPVRTFTFGLQIGLN